MIVSNTLNNGSNGEDTKQLIERALATASIATPGNIRTVFMITDNPDPIPGLNEVTATDHPSPQDTGCTFERGCVHIELTESGSGVMISSRSTLRESIQPSDAFVHNVIGHGILGMCYIDRKLIEGNDKSFDGWWTGGIHRFNTGSTQRIRYCSSSGSLRIFIESRCNTR